MQLHFEDIKFIKQEGFVRAFFLRNYYFDVQNEELEKIGKFKVINSDLIIQGPEAEIRGKWTSLLDRKLHDLYSLQGKPATYVYEGFLPLLGSLYFGILDRNTSVIEIRPLTGCNLNCIFCSVDLEKRERDFVVNVDYLIKEFKKLAQLKLKSVSEIEAHINAQGEPLLYSKLPELIAGISKIKGVKTISIDTNGTLLSEQKVNELVKAGLTRFNISLNAITQQLADKISQVHYDVERVKQICKYIAKKADILLAPVWMQGINDKEIEKIIKFALQLKKLRKKQKTPFMGIQNFLEYYFGKKPAKQLSWSAFYDKLTQLEEKYKTKLILSREDFGIKKAAVLRKPFKKGDKIKATIICNGKFPNELLASCQNRIISVRTKEKPGKTIFMKITRDKYNVFYGTII